MRNEKKKNSLDGWIMVVVVCVYVYLYACVVVTFAKYSMPPPSFCVGCNSLKYVGVSRTAKGIHLHENISISLKQWDLSIARIEEKIIFFFLKKSSAVSNHQMKQLKKWDFPRKWFQCMYCLIIAKICPRQIWLAKSRSLWHYLYPSYDKSFAVEVNRY